MKYNGITIHSAYAPEREASRYVDSINIEKGRYLFLLTGPGGEYLKKELIHRYPGSIAVSIYYGKDFYDNAENKDLSWYYGSKTSLKSFLGLSIPDFMLPVLRLVEWKPCSKAFPGIHKKVSDIVFSFLEERNASVVTTVNFNRRWIRNSYLNLMHINTVINPESFKIKKPVLITAAGPSLSQMIPLIKEYRGYFFITALPSSLYALEHNSVYPDLIVNTDPGFWNKFHFRKDFIKGIPLAMPVTASHVRGTGPVLLINQNSELEEWMSAFIPYPSVDLFETGTVAATALFLSLKLTSNRVFIAGLDLAFSDVHSHVKPHTFEIYLKSRETRIHPCLDILYSRKIDSQFKGNNRAYQTYANWFNTVKISNKVFRVNPSTVKLKSFHSLSGNEVIRLVTGSKAAVSPGISFSFDTKPKSFNQVDTTLQVIIEKLVRLKKNLLEVSGFQDLFNFLAQDESLTGLFHIFSLKEIITCVKKLSSGVSCTADDLYPIIKTAEETVRGTLKSYAETE